MEPEFTLTFEDPEDMFAVMTLSRLELFRAAKARRPRLPLPPSRSTWVATEAP